MEPVLTSLGLAVIDTINFGDGTIEDGVLGGSGVYSGSLPANLACKWHGTPHSLPSLLVAHSYVFEAEDGTGSVGALLFLSDAPQSIAFKILAGKDFPEVIESEIRQWSIDLTIQKEANLRSVRGLLEYEDTTFGVKKFRYTTPVLQIEPEDLKDTAALSALAFHFLCHPDKVADTVSELLFHRGSLGRPLVVWEPAPPSCIAENLEACLEATAVIDIFSPNHLELLRLCNRDHEPFSPSLIEECVNVFVEKGIGPSRNGLAVVRAGEHGCMIKSSKDSPAVWLPPYYGSEQSDKIVDTTGAGNAFLGGFIVGYQKTKSEIEAAYYGSVAASYMLEQIGTPNLVKSADGTKYWNDENPFQRLEKLKSRCEQE